MDTTLLAGFKFLTINVGVYSPANPAQIPFRINLTINPPIPAFSSTSFQTPWIVNTTPIHLGLENALILASKKFFDGQIENFFDEDRKTKTLLNFGNDFQEPLINWMYDPFTPDGSTVVVKFLNPLPDEIDIHTQTWISRELAPTYLDQLYVTFVPSPSTQLYLRPPNRNISVQGLSGVSVQNATLSSLLTTGSFDQTNLTDPIVEQWFTTALEGAELNIDYTNFSDFIFYSSVTARIEAFKQKLLLLENYNSIITQQSASIAAASSGSGITGFTGSAAYASYQNILEQRVELIRSFDGYERFLYYQSGSSYSSSFSGLGEDQLYFLKDATWPKVSGSVISVVSASNSSLYSIGVGNLSPEGDLGDPISWLDAINSIADQYDRYNKNKLSAAIPEFITIDSQSEEFITFVNMIGHIFDVIKLYADHSLDIYDRNSNPDDGLSPDLAWNVASSFGINLPNQFAIKELLQYVIGTQGSNPKIYKKFAAEIWKRFLHNQIYLLKTKGTAASLRGLLNTYGILPTSIQIRESATPSFYTTQSFEVIEEQTNALQFDSASYVIFPFSGSGLPAIQTIQTRFSTTNNLASSTLFNVNNAWSIRLDPSTTDFGYVTLVSGSNAVVSSSLLEIYSGNYFNLTVQQTGSLAKLWVLRANDQGDIVDESIFSGSLPDWSSGTNLYLGSSGSYNPFVGDIDEFRMWSEQLTNSVIEFQAQYPGLYNGNSTISARDNLPVRLSFGKPQNLGATQPSFIPNESPYIRIEGRPAVFTQFTASGFPNKTQYPYNMDIVIRKILRYAPNAGGSQFVSNKIVIADPPQLSYLSSDSGSSGIPVLSTKYSIRPLDQRLDDVRSNNIVGFYFSVTDAINDSIIRTIGNINIQDFIGDPQDLFNSKYSALQNLNQLYWDDYSYSFNINEFIEFVSDLLRPLFEQAKDLIPARARLLSGIVIDSPILERNKIAWTPLDLSGYNTANSTENPTLYPEPINLAPTQDKVVGEFDTKEGTIVFTNTTVPSGLIESHEATIIAASANIENGEIEYQEAPAINVDDVTQFTAQTAFYDDLTGTQGYLQYLLQRYRATSILQISATDLPFFVQSLITFKSTNTAVVEIGGQAEFIETIVPYINFDDFGVTNYFYRLDGKVEQLVPVQERVNNSVLVDVGTWVKGTTYFTNQVVTQQDQSGSAAIGNGLEFVCIVSPVIGSFISYNAPWLDTQNWAQVQYITVPELEVRVASLISGSIALTDPAFSYTPFTGYMPTHYRFRRDRSTATLNHLWRGCELTDDTTIDGKPVVEVFASAQDILVVSNNGSQIQVQNNQSGPILNIT